MKNHYKKLVAMLLAFVMLVTAIPLTVVAEGLDETISTAIDLTAEPTAGSTAEPTTEPTTEPIVETTAETTAKSTTESTAEPPVDGNSNDEQLFLEKEVMLFSTSSLRASVPASMSAIYIDGTAYEGEALEVFWNDYTGEFDHYEYSVNDLTNGSSAEISRVSTNSTNFTIPAILMINEHQYRVWVGACDAASNVLDSSQTEFYATARQVDEELVLNIPSATTANSVKITWNKITDADHYEYTVLNETSGNYIYERKSTTKAYFTIYGADIIGGNRYKVWVGAVNKNGDVTCHNIQYFNALECKHGNTTDVESSKTYTSLNDDQHHVVLIYDVKCVDCEEIIKEDQISEYDEDHTLDKNLDCTQCKHTKSCPHTDTKFVPIDGYPTYHQYDENEHIYDVQYKEICTNASCGKTVRNLVDEQRVYEHQPHDFDENGQCYDCKYVKEEEQKPLEAIVARGQDTAVTGDLLTVSVSVTGGSGVYKYGWTVLLDGEERYQADMTMDDEYSYTAEQAGSYVFAVTVEDSNGTNVTVTSEAIVVAEAACKHENTVEVTIETKYERESDARHKKITVIVRICDDCGAEISRYNREEYEEHSFENGFCSGCNLAEPTPVCTHVNGTESLISTTYASQGDTQQHTLLQTYATVCNDCGVTVGTREARVMKEHTFNENGVCDCGYAKPALECDHARKVTELVGTPVYTNQDEKYHLVEAEYKTSCADCGITLSEADSEISIETHTYVNGICVCGQLEHMHNYEKVVVGKPTYTNQNANEHSVTTTYYTKCSWCGDTTAQGTDSKTKAHSYTDKGHIEAEHHDGQGHRTFDRCVCGAVKYTGYWKYEYCEICYPLVTPPSNNTPNSTPNNNNNQQSHTHVLVAKELANKEFVMQCLLCSYQEAIEVTGNSNPGTNSHIEAMKEFSEQATKYDSKLNKQIKDLLDTSSNGMSKELENIISEYYVNGNGVLLDGIFNYIANPIDNGIDNITELLGVEEDEIIRSIIIETVCGGETPSNGENAINSLIPVAKGTTDVFGEVTSNIEGGIYSKLSGMYDAYFSTIEDIMLGKGIITSTGDIVEGKESLFAYYYDYDIAKNPSKLSAISNEYRYLQTQKALSNRTDVGFVTNIDGQKVYGPTTQTAVVFDPGTSKTIAQMDEFSDLVEDYNSSVSRGKNGDTAGILIDVIGCGLRIYSYKQQHDLEEEELNDLINEEKKYCRSIEVLNALCSSTDGNKKINDACIEFRADLLGEFKGLANDPASQNFLWKTIEAIGGTGINVTIGVAGKDKLIGNIMNTQGLARLGADILTLGGITRAENVTEWREQFQAIAWTKIKIDAQLAERTFDPAEADDGLFYLTELYYSATKREYDLYEQYIDMQYSAILPSELSQAEYYRAKAAVASAQSDLLKKQNQIRSSFNRCIQNAGGDWEFNLENDYEKFAEEYLYMANYIEMTSSDLSKPGDSMISPLDR